MSEDEIFFLPAEKAEPKEKQLLDPANVERLALGFWESTLVKL